MSNVIIDRQKIDILANAISIKSGVPLTMTLDEMVEAVDGISQVTETIPTGGNYPTFTLDISQESPTVTCDKTYAECRALVNQSNFAAVVDVPLADTIHSGQAAFYQAEYPYITYEFYRPQDGLPYASVVYYENRIEYYEMTSDKLPSGTQTVHYGTQKGTINRSTSEVYLNIPVGAVLEEKYYTISATPNGTAGTPTATKSTVSNHSVSVTPSVTNTTGYITGSTKTGTAVTVSASELVSGTKSISANGTNIDVTDYASVDVAVPSGGGAFIVTLSWDSVEELWMPDKTITALQDAYANGEEIIFACDDGSRPVSWFNYDDYVFVYSVFSFGNNELIQTYYIFTTQGVEEGQADRTIVPIFESPSVTYTPTESQQTDTVTYNRNYNYNGMEEVSVTVNAISSTYVGTGITRRSSTDLTASGATVTVPSGYYSAQASKAVASGTAGTPTATKGAVSNHSVNVTPSVTNTEGYISGGTKNGTAVTVSASELVSGTYNITSSGTKDVTNYASASVPAGSATAPSSISGTAASVSTGTNTLTLTKTVSVTPTVSAGYVSAGTAGNSSVSLTASVTTKAAATITPTTSNQTIASGTYLTGTQTISGDANLIAGNIKKNVSIFGVTGSYEGSGGSGETGMVVATKTATLSSAASSISFTGLSGEPTSFVVTSSSDQTTGGTKVVAVAYDGTSVFGMDITTQMTNDTGFSQSYSNGTLTITATSASFQANEYKLVYSYGGTTENIGTASVQVGSGATSITFTGLEDEPEYFSCVFKSTFSTSSGYQRVVEVVYDGTSTYGHEMDSSAKYSAAHWSYSYNNGSLTITSNGTNAGGYFHQPGYYQLTYAIGGDSTLQKKTVTPTSSSQTITADTAQGYTALSQVTVEGVTCSNLTAANIKSGITVKIGTDTDDDSVTSVTGTYSGGGGSSTVATKTTTNNSNTATTLSFTSMAGEPIAFFVRLTTQIARSSNNRYYYVENIRYNGTNTTGRYFYQSSGTLTNSTTHYSYSYSGTTLTLTSTGSRSAAGGSFYNGDYELVYIY